MCGCGWRLLGVEACVVRCLVVFSGLFGFASLIYRCPTLYTAIGTYFSWTGCVAWLPELGQKYSKAPAFGSCIGKRRRD